MGNEMTSNRKASTAPGFGQYAKAALFTALGTIGTVGSFYLNLTFGLKIAFIAAVGFAVADVAFFSVSLIVRQAESRRSYIKLRAMQAFFLTASLVAAGSHLAELFQQRANDAEAITQRVTLAQSTERANRAELERISELGTVAALKGQHLAAKEKADAEVGRGNCNNNAPRNVFNACMRDKAAAAALLERVGAAERRDQLTNDLNAAKQTISDTPKQAEGIEVLAESVGLTEKQGFLVVMVIVLGSFLLCSLMAEEAGEMWANIIAQRKAWKASQGVRGETRANVPGQLSEAPRAAPAPTGEALSLEDECCNRVRMMITHSQEGSMRISMNGLRETLEKDIGQKIAHSTFKDWAKRWRDGGKVNYFSSGNETVWQMPAKAA
jgi:hypothetical protein